jgi:hypothetical protein
VWLANMKSERISRKYIIIVIVVENKLMLDYIDKIRIITVLLSKPVQIIQARCFTAGN